MMALSFLPIEKVGIFMLMSLTKETLDCKDSFIKKKKI